MSTEHENIDAFLDALEAFIRRIVRDEIEKQLDAAIRAKLGRRSRDYVDVDLPIIDEE